MTSQNDIKPQNQLPKTAAAIDGQDVLTKEELPVGFSKRAIHLKELESLPHRNGVLHWTAFVVSLFSLVMLATWVFSSRGAVPRVWIIVDITLGVLFAVEFFTRSGFRWNGKAYLRSRFFDFIAIVPALALVHHGFVIEGVWLWIILVARFVRAVDRLLGDGFLQHTALAIAEGLEEEITDRVLDRIIIRIQADMGRAGFSRGVAEAIAHNKDAVLHRVRVATPDEGLVPALARIVGLDKALERTEERTYDAIVAMINSEEVDHAIRDVVNSTFSRMRTELAKKSWRQNLGIGNRRSK
jgi:hypothetical protein